MVRSDKNLFFWPLTIDAMNGNQSAPTFAKRVKAVLIRWLVFIGIVYVAFIVMLVLSENQLIYPAPKFATGQYSPPEGAEQVNIFSADDTRLVGWYYPHDQPKGILLFLHGNGEHIAHTTGLAQKLNREFALTVLALDYRGYGMSDGSPQEEGVSQDGRAAVEWLKERNGVQDSAIILMGRSLGGGIAVRLAFETDCRALVLLNTFSSMPDAAALQYPMIPVKLLMRNRFQSVEKIRACDQPLLQAHGDQDRLAPIEHARKLFEASASSQKTFVTMRGKGHNSGPTEEIWKEFKALMKTLE